MGDHHHRTSSPGGNSPSSSGLSALRRFKSVSNKVIAVQRMTRAPRKEAFFTVDLITKRGLLGSKFFYVRGNATKAEGRLMRFVGKVDLAQFRVRRATFHSAARARELSRSNVVRGGSDRRGRREEEEGKGGGVFAGLLLRARRGGGQRDAEPAAETGTVPVVPSSSSSGGVNHHNDAMFAEGITHIVTATSHGFSRLDVLARGEGRARVAIVNDSSDEGGEEEAKKKTAGRSRSTHTAAQSKVDCRRVIVEEEGAPPAIKLPQKQQRRGRGRRGYSFTDDDDDDRVLPPLGPDEAVCLVELHTDDGIAPLPPQWHTAAAAAVERVFWLSLDSPPQTIGSAVEVGYASSSPRRSPHGSGVVNVVVVGEEDRRDGNNAAPEVWINGEPRDIVGGGLRLKAHDGLVVGSRQFVLEIRHRSHHDDNNADLPHAWIDAGVLSLFNPWKVAVNAEVAARVADTLQQAATVTSKDEEEAAQRGVDTLCFCAAAIDDASLRQCVCRVLACTNGVTALDLSLNPRITVLGTEILAQTLRDRRQKKETVLWLRECRLGCAAIGALSSALGSLREIDLQGNECGAEGAQMLSEAFKGGHCALTRLSLQDNLNIGDSGATALAQAMFDGGDRCRLRVLNLAQCGVGDEGAKALARAIRHVGLLVDIDLWSNSIGDLGAVAFAEALGENDSALSSLGLGHNLLTVSGASELFRCLHVSKSIDHGRGSTINNSALRCLHLHGTRLGVDGARELAAALEQDCSLTSMELEGSYIGDEGAERLAEALRGNTTLTFLSISGAEGLKIGNASAHVFGNCLRVNATLTAIAFPSNAIGDKGAGELAAGLNENSTVTSLDCFDNAIAEEGALRLAEMLKHNHTLQSLYLTDNPLSKQAASMVSRAWGDRSSMLCL